MSTVGTAGYPGRLLLPCLSPLSETRRFVSSAAILNDLQLSGFTVTSENGVGYLITPCCSPLGSLSSYANSYRELNLVTERPAHRPRTSSVMFTPKTSARTTIHFKDRPSTPEVPSPALSRTSSTAGVAGGEHSHMRHKPPTRFTRMGTSEDSYEMAKTLDCTRLSPVPPKPGTTPPLLSRAMSSPVPPSESAELPASLPPVPEASTEVPVLTPRPFTASALPTKRVVADLATRPGTAGVHTIGRSVLPNLLLRSAITPEAAKTPVLTASRPQHIMQQFKATRGHALMVFHDMDRDKNGKLTRSEFEDGALAVGYSLSQANTLFDKFDRGSKGYLKPSDWGMKDLGRVVERFSVSYMQKFLGLPDITATPEQVKRYWHTQDLRSVRSLPAAINMCRINALARASRSPQSTGDPVFDTFKFIDTDGSGGLTLNELRDAFHAMGVFISQAVMDQIMTIFDKDNNGIVNYYEFVQTMFPKAQKMGR